MTQWHLTFVIFVTLVTLAAGVLSSCVRYIDADESVWHSNADANYQTFVTCHDVQWAK